MKVLKTNDGLLQRQDSVSLDVYMTIPRTPPPPSIPGIGLTTHLHNLVERNVE